MKNSAPSRAAAALLALPFLALSACQTTSTAPGEKTSQPVERFNAADLDGDGKLNRAESRNYLVSRIFEARDNNKDGIMTLAEWDPAPNAEVKAAFAKRDANSDGKVTLAEAEAYAAKAGAFNSDFDGADANQDGYLTFEEVIAYYDSKEGPIR